MKRVLLKLSGEALAGDKKTGFDEPTVTAVAHQVKELVDDGLEVGIVIGGGNFWRGRSSEKIDRTKADQKFTVFSIDSQKIFSAARTFLSGDVFMTEGSVCCFDLGDQLFRVAPDTGKEGFLLQLASGDFSKLQFPGSGQLRLFQVLRHQL